MGLSSSVSFSKVFFLLMVLIVSSPINNSPSPSPSNDSPSPRGPKNLVVLVCHFTSPSSTAKNSVVVINYNDRTANRSKGVRGANFSPEGDRDVLNAVLSSYTAHGKDGKLLLPGIGGSHGQNSNNNQL